MFKSGLYAGYFISVDYEGLCFMCRVGLCIVPHKHELSQLYFILLKVVKSVSSVFQVLDHYIPVCSCPWGQNGY